MSAEDEGATAGLDLPPAAPFASLAAGGGDGGDCGGNRDSEEGGALRARLVAGGADRRLRGCLTQQVWSSLRPSRSLPCSVPLPTCLPVFLCPPQLPTYLLLSLFASDSHSLLLRGCIARRARRQYVRVRWVRLHVCADVCAGVGSWTHVRVSEWDVSRPKHRMDSDRRWIGIKTRTGVG